jgi:glutathione S-transferase
VSDESQLRELEVEREGEMGQMEIVGRSSSHFTRVTRIFAIELGVEHTFRPVLDLSSTEANDYAGNPALKVPVLVDASGSLFGTENVCRELARRSGKASSVVMRGDVADRVVANVEELTLNAMTSEVSLIMAKMAGDPRLSPPKVSRSLENALRWLDDNVDAALATLPPARTLSFLEAALFSLVTHLPFRQVLDVSPWKRLGEHCARFGVREGARRTEYRFDAA